MHVRALMMGRFQPFHLGHLDLARRILDDNDEIIIAITSSQFNYLLKDPFTAGRGWRWVHGSLRGAGIDLSRCFVAAIENQPNVATWAGYLRAALPRFERVYSGNRYVAMLLGDFGTEVIPPEFADRGRLSGTAIRELMACGGDWRSRVPREAAEVIVRVGGAGRMAAITGSDTDPTRH